MKLEGSCHCGAVRFTVDSATPYPYMRCYCTICRKTAGGGGYAINLGADSGSLKIEGEENLSVYRVASAKHEGGLRQGRRHFCKICGSALWVYDPRWPELVHPFASAIDTALPVPPETVHIMLGSKAGWVAAEQGEGHFHCDEYPEKSLSEWHQRHRL
jgi:hypothetical protein